MKKYGYIKEVLIGTGVVAAALFGVAVSANAQSVDHEYIKWKNAQRTAEYRHDKYLASNSTHDLHKWQSAQEKLQKRYAKMEKRGINESDFAVYENELPGSISNSSMTASIYDTARYDRNAANFDKTDHEMSALVRSTDTAVTKWANRPETTNSATDNMTADEPANPSDAGYYPMSTTMSDDSSYSTTDNSENPDVSGGPSADSVNYMPMDSDSPMEMAVSTPILTGTIIVDDKEVDVAIARNTVNDGYMYGYKKGEKDRKHKHDYDATVTMPSRGTDQPSVIPSGRYKRYYEAGYTRGYEDGFKDTTKYGTVSKIGSQIGYSMRGTELDAVMSSTTSADTKGSMEEL